MFREYLDFEIRIDAQTASGYPVSVRSPGGDTRGWLVTPLDSPAYLRALERLALLDSDEESLAEIGHTLFDRLFTAPIREAYARSRGQLKDGQALRLIFDIAASEGAIAAMPWEFLADPAHGPLVMLDAPITRYLPIPAPIPTLATPLPLKVLLTGASTPPPVDITGALDRIQTALGALGASVAVTVERHLSRSTLQRRMREGFHVWHFVGHGGIGRDGETGLLQFEDDQGSGDVERVSAPELGILLQRSGVRLVVLNACQSATLGIDPFRSLAPALIRAEVPAVIAMQLQLSEEASEAFACEFYRTLAEGWPIDACLTEGRKAIMGATGLSQPFWGIPVVYTRAADGRLFAPPLPATPEHADEHRPIGDGLVALRALMDMPAIYAAVASSRDQFPEVLRQIATLSRYKELHDQLQQLEACAQVLDTDRQRLQSDPLAWRALSRSEPDLYDRIDAVLALPSTGARDALWTRKLGNAQREVRAAVEACDATLLNQAANRIDDVLGTVPWQINTRLVEVASGLPLPALVQNLTTIAERLDQVELDAAAQRQSAVFLQSVSALDQLSARLTQLVGWHNLFQELDNELRRVESDLRLDSEALALVWPDLLLLHQQICDEATAPWAQRLRTQGDELAKGLAAADTNRIMMLFWRYRSQVSQSFNIVDTDLLGFCKELEQIGASLDSVLRTIA
jgi:hypothetical protein